MQNQINCRKFTLFFVRLFSILFANCAEVDRSALFLHLFLSVFLKNFKNMTFF